MCDPRRSGSLLPRTLAFALVSALAACGSSHDCADCHAPIDGARVCTGDADCAAPTAVCDLADTRTCVQCTQTSHAVCADLTPACGDDHACRGCITHGECPGSNVCLPDGSCADTATVAYVQAGGTGTTCTQAAPCGSLAIGVAASLPVVKIMKSATPLADTAVTSIARKVTILADPGAAIDRTGDGVILEIKAPASVEIFDLEITGATGAGNPAISLPSGGVPKLRLSRVTVDANQGPGVAMSAAGVLTVDRSTIRGNQGVGISASAGGVITITQATIADNQGLGVAATAGGVLTISRSTISGNKGGGLSAQGAGLTFGITNNLVARNGDKTASLVGGVDLQFIATSSRLELNTIVDNDAAVGAGGVSCNVTGFAAPNNLIARNSLAGSATAAGAQTSGACSYPTSLVQNDIAGLAFKHPDPPAPFDYHLTTGSAAIDAALTPSDLDTDIDGDRRPQGAHDDIGADEYHP